MRRSADEIGATRFHFGRKCLAIRHRLLTEFFPPIESARQESNRAHGFFERAHARPRGNDERTTEPRHVSPLCLNGVGHDDDSPNAASFDAANPNCACKPEPCADARHRQIVNEWPVPKKAPNPTDRHIGSRVRMRRKMLAMSQTRLADALGITYQQVQKNESGTNRIAATRLQQISHILRVPIAFFFEGTPEASAPRGPRGSALSIAQIDDFVASSEGLSLIGAFMRVHNADLRRKIVMLVQGIAGDDGN